MRPNSSWHATILALSVAACGTSGSASTALNPPVIDTLHAGLVHLRNTGPTAWTDTNGWKFTEVATINPPDGSPGELGITASMTMGDDGTVYAFQQKPASIKVYGPDGHYIRDIGREGDGPGELRSGMLNIRGDTLVIQDPNGRHLTFLKTDGTFLKTVPSTCCYWTNSLTIDSAGRIWSPGSVGKDGKGGWVRFRMDGSTVDTVLMPPQKRESGDDKYWTVTVKNGNNSGQMMMSIPLQPATWQFLRSDGAVVTGSTEHLAFAVLSNGKDSSRVFEAEAPRLPLSETQRDSAFEHAISRQSEQWREGLRKTALKDDLPKIWPAWTNVSTDRMGRLWVSLPGDRGEITRLVVFDRDGRLLGDVPPPSAKMFSNTAWSRDRLAFLDEDDSGHPVIRVFRLNTTGGK